jgi:hypothetical protein
MRRLTNLPRTCDASGRLERAAVRVVLVDSSGAVLMLSTRDASNLSEPLWHRDVLYTYRGERRLQHESVCVARIVGTAPAIDTKGRDTVELEDHLYHRWWRIDELLASGERFYPRSLQRHIEGLLAGHRVDDPLESWDESSY